MQIRVERKFESLVLAFFSKITKGNTRTKMKEDKGKGNRLWPVQLETFLEQQQKCTEN